MNIKSCEMVYASEFEEFFNKEDHSVVSEGQPVGIDLELDDEVKFVLFDDIYWCNEKEKSGV
mgnify:CR=1 FL=1